MIENINRMIPLNTLKTKQRIQSKINIIKNVESVIINSHPFFLIISGFKKIIQSNFPE